MSEHLRPAEFNRNPMLWLGTAFAFGILLAGLVDYDLGIAAGSSLIIAILGFMLRSTSASTWLVFASFVLAGSASAIAEKRSVSPDRLKILYDNKRLLSGDPVEIEGVLLGRPEASVDGALLHLAVARIKNRNSECKASGKVRLYLQTGNFPTDDLNLKYGSRLIIATILERDDEYLNPGVIPKREILDRLGIDATGSIKSSLLIEKVADESVFLPLAWVYDQRARMIDDFRRNLSGPAAGVMIASLLGNKQFLDKNTADLFRDGGTFHILVISGLHITFIGGLLLLFLRQITRNRWLQFSVTTTILWAYTLAVGADVPVVRAALMFTVMLFSFVIYRRGGLLNSLGLCGLLLLVWRPSELLNPSFQLTFVSVGAIVAIAYPLLETTRKIGGWTPGRATPFPPRVPLWLTRLCETIYWSDERWNFDAKRQIWSAKLLKSPFLNRRINDVGRATIRYLFEGILVSVIVQICMLPLSIIYFHRVSLISVLLNLWVGIFIALESFAAVLGLFASQFSSLLGRGFFAIAEGFNWLMMLLPSLFTDYGWLSFRLPSYTGNGQLVYPLFFIPILVLAFAVNRWRPFFLKQTGWFIHRRVMAASLMALGILSAVMIFHPLSAPRPDGRLHVDFLDVGQGDAAFVTFPNGQTMLVDSGGRISYRKMGDDEAFIPDSPGIGESVVSEFLWHQGYSQIDYILTTHADADHMQGFTDIAKNFNIDAAIFGSMPSDNPEFLELSSMLKRRGVRSELVKRGEVFDIGGVSVEVLFPTPGDERRPVSNNDDSVVLRLVYGNRNILLTGDIEEQAELELTNGSTVLSADVVKVPHHGSRTSSMQAFVDAVGARYAVISVGRKSPFGHPHPEVVDRWQKAGARVLATGERGTVSISTDGNDMEVKTFTP